MRCASVMCASCAIFIPRSCAHTHYTRNNTRAAPTRWHRRAKGSHYTLSQSSTLSPRRVLPLISYRIITIIPDRIGIPTIRSRQPRTESS